MAGIEAVQTTHGDALVRCTAADKPGVGLMRCHAALADVLNAKAFDNDVVKTLKVPDAKNADARRDCGAIAADAAAADNG